MAFDPDPLGAVFAARRTLAPAAVGSQVLLMSVISVNSGAHLVVQFIDSFRRCLQIATIILFNFLRPKNKVS